MNTSSINSVSDRNDVVFEVNELKKTYTIGLRRRKVYAVRRSHFSVHTNEIVGLVGPNGAGKTTTMKMITGLVRPDSGSVSMFGLSATDPESRRRLGYLPENPYFYEHLTGRELLRFYANLFGLRGHEIDKKISRLIDKVGLNHAADRAIKNYSKGMRQRVGIAQALINDPDLIILDEPQSGLDPIGRREIRDIILEQKEEGKTVLFSSHILPDVEAVCDRIVIMKKGRSVELENSQWSDLLSKKTTLISFALPVNAEERLNDILKEFQSASNGATDEVLIKKDLLVVSTSNSEALQSILEFAIRQGYHVVNVEHKDVDYETLLMSVLDADDSES